MEAIFSKMLKANSSIYLLDVSMVENNKSILPLEQNNLINN